MMSFFKKISFLLALCLVISCSKFNPEIAKKKKINPNTFEDAIIKNFQTELYTGVIKNWQLKGINAKIFEKQNLLILNSIEMNHLDKNGNVLTQIKAEYGHLDNNTKNIILSNKVLITHANKKTIIQGNYFFWDHEKQLLTSPTRVTIKQPNNEVISGIGFQSDKNLQNITFLSNVKGVKQRL